MNNEYSYEIYDSISQIDSQEWNQLVNHHDLAMDQRLIQLLENTLSQQAQFWTVVIRDQQKKLIAGACLALFQVDIVQSSAGLLQSGIQRLRKRWPNALKMKVLFCGLPLPSGHSHFRIHPEVVNPRPILQLITQAMKQVAKQKKAALLVLKELDQTESEQTRCLNKWGFICGELEPLYLFSSNFKNFSEYQAALRATYRRQVQQNIKKFKQFEMEIEHLTDPLEISQRFNDSVHQLYLNVWSRAKEKLECFSADFFRNLPLLLPQQTMLTLITLKQQPVAFALGIYSQDAYHNLYVGLDYAYQDSADLYFNLFYEELAAVFQANQSKIWIGQTSGSFKSRLGAAPHSRFFKVRAMNPCLRFIFKYFRKLIFPQLTSPNTHRVFVSRPA